MPKAEADAVVVSVGPGGSATAANLARWGMGVLLLEKSYFPHEKVYGDRSTLRTTRALVCLGIDASEKTGQFHSKGLHVYGEWVEPFQLGWPKLTDFPSYGLVQKRIDFNDLMAKHVVGCGVGLVQGASVTEVALNDRTDRIIGVRTRDSDEYHIPLVVTVDGNSSRLSVSMGLNKRSDHPMEVAYCIYYRPSRSDDDYLESQLGLWDSKPHESTLMPGYGWILGMNDGTCSVGLGALNASRSSQRTDYRELMERWLTDTPGGWDFREESRLGEVQGATLPMAFNRQPVYGRDLLLVGGLSDIVNPFNGEGITYTMELTELAVDAIAQAHAHGAGTESTERALHGYRAQLRARLGGYY